MLPRPALALALAALLATGCTRAAQPAAAPPAARMLLPSRFAPDRPAPPPAVEERLGRVAAAIPEAAKILREGVQKAAVPNAAIGIVVGDRLAYAEGFGQRTDRGGLVDASTVFRIGSITKVFTGLSMLLLRDEGRLGLDDPLVRWIPELDECTYPTLDSPAITLRNLVTHTSGMPRIGSCNYADGHLVTEEELIRAGRAAALEFTPGTEARYSNLAMALGGLVVGRAAGEPLRDFVSRRILGPLGMTSTVWDRERVPPDKLADGHSHTAGGYAPAPVHWRLGAAEGMGGLYSSIGDMARFALFELSAWPPRNEPDRGPVKRSSVRESHEVAGMARAGKQAFGINWVLINDGAMGYVITHNGGTEGYSSCMVLGPGRGFGILFLSSSMEGVDDLVRKAFAVLARADRGEPAASERPAGGRTVIFHAALELDPPAQAALAKIAALIENPDAAAIDAAFAPQFFDDVPRDDALKLLKQVHDEVGACKPPVVTAARGGGAGSARIDCAKGSVSADFRGGKAGIEALRLTPVEGPPK
jgi:CubicO group peptidase (beta-lactamase class C family)